jgi:hypothetical protein
MDRFKKELQEYISGLTLKKQKSSGKKYFYDSAGYLILDITIKSKLVFTHRSSFPFLNDLSDKESEILMIKVLEELDHSVSGVAFCDYSSERENYEKIKSAFGSKYADLFQEAYNAYKYPEKINQIEVK